MSTTNQKINYYDFDEVRRYATIFRSHKVGVRHFEKYRRISLFIFKFLMLGKLVFIEGSVMNHTVVLILMKDIKKWVNFDNF